MNKIIYIFLLLSLVSCGKNFKQKSNSKTSRSNEHLLKYGNSLEVPPHYNPPLPSNH